MTIGRLQFGIATGNSAWKAYKGLCGCLMIDLGPFYATWLTKDCKQMWDEKYFKEE